MHLVGPSDPAASLAAVGTSTERLITPAERAVADALDRLGATWAYEPHCFVIAVDDEGREREACSPDFYLPASGVYLEVCSGSARRLNRKRAKLRRLARAHPELEVVLLGPREVAALVAAPRSTLDRLTGGRRLARGA